jgi:signal transduction histidine kinase
MDSELTHEISNLLPGDHLCLFYENDPAEQISALIPFVQEGLSRHEQFIYIADDRPVRELEDQLRASGINVSEETDRGTLKLWTGEQWREPGELCSKKKAIQILNFIKEAASSSFNGCRLAVEMTGALGPDITPQQLEQWESLLNTTFVPGFSGRIVCQYNWSHLSPETMLVALRTHRLAVLGDHVYPNWFHETPSGLNHKGKFSAAAPEWLIAVLNRSRAAQKELEAAHQRLKEAQALAAIGGAAAKIVHDMTNALNAISTTIQLQERYLERDSERLPELIAGPIQDLKEETARVRALIDRLRVFSQPIKLKLEPVNPAQIIERVIDEISTRNQAGAIEIEQQLSGDLPTIVADEEQLRRALLNLCLNAVEAMPQGGKLTLKCFPRLPDICLEVKDTGCGICEGLNVFEPFTSSKPNAWGLGLAIAQRIISAHRGVIDYCRAGRQGTSFKIRLPGPSRERTTKANLPFRAKSS